MWHVKAEESQITLHTGNEEISAVPGSVIFRPRDVRGERCGNEFPVSVSDLGMRGELSVSSIRKEAPDVRVMISPHTLVISGVNDSNAVKVLAQIGKLQSSNSMAQPGEVQWLSHRMVRITAPPGIVLSNVHRTLHFDTDKNHLPLYDLGLKAIGDELTYYGKLLLEKLVGLANEISIKIVGISRDFVELCMDGPQRDKKEVQQAVNTFSFAVA